MENEHLILAQEFCTHYNVEISFINDLQENGLIKMRTVEERYFIDTNQLQRLEQFARWHYDLDINLEGIEVIDQLLNRVRNMHIEIVALQNRLRLFEENINKNFLNQAEE